MIYLNISKSVLHLMNVIENKTDMTGKEKYNNVLNDMKIILGDVLYFQYESMIEDIIEMFVSISKNEIVININKDVKSNCCCF